jgi:CubicO group peptidase (beta-lactamase class C family)
MVWLTLLSPVLPNPRVAPGPGHVRATDSCREFGGTSRRARNGDRRLPRARLGQSAEHQAVLVSRRGELLAERYYNSDVAEYLEIHSATKGVISTLVGIALTKGDLKSLNQTVGELLPQHRSAMSKSSARTSVRQLADHDGRLDDRLRPGAGQAAAGETSPHRGTRRRSGHLRLLRHRPASALGRAGPGHRHVDTGIRAARAAGPARDHSQPTIEGPISDVDKPDVVNTNSFRWLCDPDGVHAGPFGLALTARDMIKIGELWLNGGVWHGRRILDADYISQASTNQVPSSMARSVATGISGGTHRWRRTGSACAVRRACTGS